jgi:hypothetical protein
MKLIEQVNKGPPDPYDGDAVSLISSPALATKHAATTHICTDKPTHNTAAVSPPDQVLLRRKADSNCTDSPLTKLVRITADSNSTSTIKTQECENEDKKIQILIFFA